MVVYSDYLGCVVRGGGAYHWWFPDFDPNRARYSFGDRPEYCLKYLPKKDCVEKFNLVAISLMVRSEHSSSCFDSAMVICMVHVRTVLPDFSLITDEK